MKKLYFLLMILPLLTVSFCQKKKSEDAAVAPRAFPLDALWLEKGRNDNDKTILMISRDKFSAEGNANNPLKTGCAQEQDYVRNGNMVEVRATGGCRAISFEVEVAEETLKIKMGSDHWEFEKINSGKARDFFQSINRNNTQVTAPFRQFARDPAVPVQPTPFPTNFWPNQSPNQNGGSSIPMTQQSWSNLKYYRVQFNVGSDVVAHLRFNPGYADSAHTQYNQAFRGNEVWFYHGQPLAADQILPTDGIACAVAFKDNLAPGANQATVPVSAMKVSVNQQMTFELAFIANYAGTAAIPTGADAQNSVIRHIRCRENSGRQMTLQDLQAGLSVTLNR